MAPWFEDLSIRARVALFVMAMLLPVATLVFLLLAADLRQVRHAAQERVRVIAGATATELGREVVASRSLLERLSARPGVRALDPARCDPLIADAVALDAGFQALELFDARGEVVCSSRPRPAAALSAPEAIAFQQVLRLDAFQAGRVEVSPTSGRPLVALSHPVHDDAGRPAGLLRLSIDLLWLNEALLGAVPGRAVVAVTDRTGTMLMRSVGASTFIGTRPRDGAIDGARDRPSGFVEAAGRDGIVRLYAFETIPGIGWRVSAGQPGEEVYAEYHGLLVRSVGLGLGGLLLVALLGWRLSAAIVRPVFSLERAVRRIAEGDGSARARIFGPPEVRSLATQFNRMLDARAISDARLQGIFESAVDGIITTDETQTVVQANPAAAQLFGYPMGELVGLPLSRFIPARHRASHQEEVRAFGLGSPSKRHMSASRDVMALHADGTEFPIEASISHMEIAGQRFYTVIHRDVTERNRFQAALQAGKSTLEAALSSMTDAVLITDADGHVAQCNAAFARFHRFRDVDTCLQVLEQSPSIVELALPDGAPAPVAQRPVARALAGETAADVEYRLRRRDTGEAWIGSYGFAPIRSTDGTLVGAVVVSRDVTVDKEAQDDLEASHAALQRLIAAQDRVQEDERARIARELHDDLQQTLAALRIDLADLAARMADAPGDQTALLEELDDLAAQAIVSTRRAVDDLRPRMLEELGLVPALQALAAPFARRTGIACEVDAPPGLDREMKHRPLLATCLYRVTQEALNNAAKHSRATAVAVRLEIVAGMQVSLCIVDNGRGFTARDRRKAGSFGLMGMAERVRAQGGSLRVENLATGGTLLEVIAPLADGEESALLAMPDSGRGDDAAGPDSGFEHPFRDSSGATLDLAPLPRLLSRTAGQALQAVIDAMPGNVAILDHRGVVRFVNRAWHAFAERNGNPGSRATGPGVNYVEVCRHSARDDPGALPVLLGLEALIANRVAEYVHDYPCHTPGHLQWFRLHAAPIANGDILVSHFLLAAEPRTHDETPR